MPVSLTYSECQQILAGKLSPELREKLQNKREENAFLVAVRDAAIDFDEDTYVDQVDDTFGWSPEDVNAVITGDKLEVSVYWEHDDRRGGNHTLTCEVVVDGDTATVDGEQVEKDVKTVVAAVLKATFFDGGC